MNEGLVDTRLRQETPEGVELTLSPAGPVPRALAWGLDFAIRGIVYVTLAVALDSFGSGGSGLLFIVGFVLEWGYPVYFEYATGSTPGKQAVGLKVALEDGSPLTFGAAVLRNLVRFVDFFPVGYVFGMCSCMASARYQRLGDLAARTLVIHGAGRAVRSLPAQIPPRPPSMPLTVDEQRAIVAFAERAEQWSDERREELALHTGSCTRGSRRERVEQLLGYARWIAGER